MKHILIAAMLIVALAQASCSRPEPPLTDDEATEMMAGVVITNHGKKVQLTSKRLHRVQVIPGTQQGHGSNHFVQVRFLSPDPVTAELVERKGQITFVRHEYGRSRIGFQLLENE